MIASIGVRAAPTDSAITKLREIAITSGNPELQQTAIGTLANTGGDRGVDALLYIYDAPHVDDDMELKKSTIRALGISGNSRAVPKLKQIAKSDPDAALRLEAVRSFAHLGSAHDFAVRPVRPLPAVESVEPLEPIPAAPPAPPTPPAPDKKK